MLFIGLVAVVVSCMIWAGMVDRSWVSVLQGSLLGALAGFIVFCLIAGVVVALREDEEWIKVDETVYELAEGSTVTSDGSRVSFVAELDGGEVAARYVTAPDVYVTDLEETSEVVVHEWHMEHGAEIFPWGEGEDRMTVEVR